MINALDQAWSDALVYEIDHGMEKFSATKVEEWYRLGLSGGDSGKGGG